jgi:hypothetical protein
MPLWQSMHVFSPVSNQRWCVAAARGVCRVSHVVTIGRACRGAVSAHDEMHQHERSCRDVTGLALR